MPKVNCPTCKKQSEYIGNDFRPFCSERCKLIDFGDWVDGNFSLPDRNTLLSEEDFKEIERISLEKESIK